ncbi:MAG: BrnT family toxin [Deltaproteobacteria bacterium]|nr:BrnT family toxin [Deltaproteobacteria bacterium]
MVFKGLKGFDWDAGNTDKNEAKHGVTNLECEEVFFNRPLIVTRNPELLQGEDRYLVLGRTHAKRLLFVVFTRRGERIRVISARPMSRKERILYEQEKTT